MRAIQPTAPAGVVINASGIITWTPASGQSPSTNLVTTVVTNTDAFDLVNPHLSATNSVTVIVNPIPPFPILTAPAWLGNGQFQFSFRANSNVTYSVLYSTNLLVWSPYFEFDGQGGEIILIDPNAGSSPHRFYRVQAGH